MPEYVLLILTVVAAVGAGLIGGVFFAFSTFVMRALGKLPVAQGIAAMQSINIVVINPLFLGPFFGTGVACLALIGWSLGEWDGMASVYRVAGALLYLFGTIGVTVWCNVPRNDALAKVDPASDEGSRVWADYLRGWTWWNHVRTAAALAASALFILSLPAGRQYIERRVAHEVLVARSGAVNREW